MAKLKPKRRRNAPGACRPKAVSHPNSETLFFSPCSINVAVFINSPYGLNKTARRRRRGPTTVRGALGP